VGVNPFIPNPPTQTEFDATLTVAHALFRLFDPAHAYRDLDFSRELKNHWLEFRAYLVEITLWHLFNRYFESADLSYYHFQNYPLFWQQIQDGNYYQIWRWMIERSTKNSRIAVVEDSYFYVLPPLQGKMPVEPSPLLTAGGSEVFERMWNEILKKGPVYDGILVGAKILETKADKQNILERLNSDMKTYLATMNPNFHNDNPEVVFKLFYEALGKNGVTLPEELNQEMNPFIRGEF
jgi:hypothetical protein